MTGEEFRNGFNVLFNNVTSNLAPGLDDYEISVFLNKSQNELLKNYFLALSNPKLAGFDANPKRLYDFSSLIKTVSPSTATVATKINPTSITYEYPSDLLYALNEEVICNGIPYTVVPLSFTEYSMLMRKPYKFPPKHTVWRLNTNNKYYTSSSTTETVSINVGNNILPFTTISSYGKPVRIILIIKTGSGNSAEPIIEETPDEVRITMTVCKGDYTDLEHYYNDWDVRNELDGYLDFPDDESVTGMFFPASVLLYDLQGSAEGLTLVNIVNAGGIKEATGTIVELIGNFKSPRTYTIRYIRKPLPIIISDLTGLNLSIDGYNGTTSNASNSKGNSFYANGKCCELPEEMHEEVLQRAVELAKIAWQGDVQSSMQAGVRSE